MTAEQQDKLIEILFDIEKSIQQIKPFLSPDLFEKIDKLGTRFILDRED